MAEPTNPNKLTPFQAAMLKFEQAVKESVEAELAAQRAAQQAAQRPYMTQGRPVQRPQQRAPGYPAASPYHAPPARPVMQPTPAIVPSDADLRPEMADDRQVYLNVGEHTVSSTLNVDEKAVESSLTDNVVEIAPQVTAFDEKAAASGKPAAKAALTVSSTTQLSVLKIRNANPLMQGVVWAEVLGRPVSKRKGRGRYGF